MPPYVEGERESGWLYPHSKHTNHSEIQFDKLGQRWRYFWKWRSCRCFRCLLQDVLLGFLITEVLLLSAKRRSVIGIFDKRSLYCCLLNGGLLLGSLIREVLLLSAKRRSVIGIFDKRSLYCCPLNGGLKDQ